jgi:hypothetical protein
LLKGPTKLIDFQSMSSGAPSALMGKQRVPLYMRASIRAPLVFKPNKNTKHNRHV